jgi:RimJ/RimL family protein N-acetyltransferase
MGGPIFEEMPQADYERTRSLFRGFDYQVVVRAVIENTSPGRIWVDNCAKPLSGFMATTEGWFLAGRSDNHGFNEGLRQLVHRMILRGDYYSPVNPEFLHELFFHIDSEDWTSRFSHIFDIRHPLPTGRVHLICEDVTLDWKQLMPEGYRLLEVDAAFDTSSLVFPEDIRAWMEHSLEEQKKRGFGMCLAFGTKVVVWVNADCASGDECEVGIITTQDYRMQGLGSLTAAAAVERCLSGGYSRVGWHCENHNYASLATARKVGFVKERDYVHYICMFDETVHMAESGMRHFYNGDYESAISDFEEAIRLGEVEAFFHFLMARSYGALGDIDRFTACAVRAKRLGWGDWEAVLSDAELRSCFTHEQWHDLAAQLR